MTGGPSIAEREQMVRATIAQMRADGIEHPTITAVQQASRVGRNMVNDIMVSMRASGEMPPRPIGVAPVGPSHRRIAQRALEALREAKVEQQQQQDVPAPKRIREDRAPGYKGPGNSGQNPRPERKKFKLKKPRESTDAFVERMHAQAESGWKIGKGKYQVAMPPLAERVMCTVDPGTAKSKSKRIKAEFAAFMRPEQVNGTPHGIEGLVPRSRRKRSLDTLPEWDSTGEGQ